MQTGQYQYYNLNMVPFVDASITRWPNLIQFKRNFEKFFQYVIEFSSKTIMQIPTPTPNLSHHSNTRMKYFVNIKNRTDDPLAKHK
jgi:hypothetical protein